MRIPAVQHKEGTSHSNMGILGCTSECSWPIRPSYYPHPHPLHRSSRPHL